MAHDISGTFERPALASLADEMERHGTSRDAPVREIMALLGDRWSTLILLVLATGELRHAELRRLLARLSAERAISQRILTMKLRTLERDGFVTRRISSDVPPKVSYNLTRLGESLHVQTRGLINWINAHQDLIRASRAVFDSEEE
ncbi:winged helix-turn-helix transcriptional regulator [Novosphingobium subterraneum]|uniref:winged helix-turn-helix transcriptional regulator n=1 Tax=Novosphingobium subterraneum TaxID=48936 RepID=UPI003D0333B6